MRRKKITLMLFLIIVLSFAFSIAQDKSKVFDFPIKPGTKQWNSISSHQKILEMLQIPETILKELSTEALVGTCLNYPFIDDIWCYNRIQDGIGFVEKDFNGIRELSIRKDAGLVLLKKYKEMPTNDIKKEWSLLEQGMFTAKYRHIEILMSYASLLNNMNKSDRVLLLSEAIKKHQDMIEAKIYGHLNMGTNAYLIGCILVSEKYDCSNRKNIKNKDFVDFIKHASFMDNNVINEIIDCGNEYLTNNR